jgi:hypothetical protein
MAGEILYLGGIFNITDPLFHLQLYIWTWILACIFSVICWVAWRYGPWKGYEALWGLYYAFKAESNAAFISGPQLYFVLKSEAAAKCIFDYSGWEYELPRSRVPEGIRRAFFNYATAFLDNIDWAHALVYKFGHRNMDVEIAKSLQDHEWEEAPSTTIGGIRTDIILDGDLWVSRDTPQHKAIEAYCLKWNEEHPENQIHSYSKLQRLMKEGVINSPEGVKKEIVIPWVRIDSAFPTAMEDNETAGYKRQAAEEMANEEANALSKYFIPMLAAGFGLAILLLIVRFASLHH